MNDFDRRSSSSIVPRKSSKLGIGEVLAAVSMTRVLEIHADQFQRGDHRIAIGDMMLALPIDDCALQGIVFVHAANLSAACGSVRRRSAARYSCR